MQISVNVHLIGQQRAYGPDVATATISFERDATDYFPNERMALGVFKACVRPFSDNPDFLDTRLESCEQIANYAWTITVYTPWND